MEVKSLQIWEMELSSFLNPFFQIGKILAAPVFRKKFTTSLKVLEGFADSVPLELGLKGENRAIATITKQKKLMRKNKNKKNKNTSCQKK